MDTAKELRLDDPLGPVEQRLDPAGNRLWAIERLNEMFAAGKAPDPPPDAFLKGRLVTMSLSRPTDAFVRSLTRLWMPWLGKGFDAASNAGINVLRPSARLPMKALWPSYRPGSTAAGELEAFPFRTRVAPGELDPGQGLRQVDVLKIDYDFEANPNLLIRSILDELVEVEDGFYLGRILFRFRGRFRPIGFFCLQR